MKLAVPPDGAAKTLKEALRFRFCRCAGRPAFHYFKREKSEKQLPGSFQIEPQILGNLLHRAGTIELGPELGLI